MSQAHARTEIARTAGQVVELSVLSSAARKNARRRAQETWLAVAMVAAVGAFAVAFGWYVLFPAIRTLAGS